jgi:uncharacterized membrane protein
LLCIAFLGGRSGARLRAPFPGTSLHRIINQHHGGAAFLPELRHHIPRAALMTLSNLLHLLSAMLWIGGMAFALFALRPAAIATLAPPQRLPLMTAALGHFFRMVMAAIVVLLASGLHMLFAAGGFGAARPGVHVMFGGGLAMMAIFGYVAHGCHPKLRRHAAAEQWPMAAALLERIRLLVLVNLVLGVLIVAAVKFL